MIWSPHQRGYEFYQSNSSSNKIVEQLISTLLVITFEAFVIYALATGNGTEISEKCGDSLWKFVLSRLILSFIEGIIIICMGSIQMLILFSSLRPETSASLEFYCLIIGAIFMLGLHAVLIGVGFTITNKSMEDAACNAALSSASFSNTPLLGIVGYVFVVIDCLILFLVTCSSLCIGCMGLAMNT
jgi:hypothetical protein